MDRSPEEHSSESPRLSSLRVQIQRIRADPTLRPSERFRLIQALISPSTCSSSSSALPLESRHEWQITESDLATTYHGPGHSFRGCKHYRVNGKIRAECCGRFFPCRFCHDEGNDHTINRYDTKEMLCMLCNTVQPINKSCTNCHSDIARYYCDVCKFFDDTPNKNIYHCQYCNICRVGKGLGIDYFHCDKCNACISMSMREHECIQDTLKANCPVCLENMFASTNPVVFMPCNHSIHSTCFHEYTRQSYKCPVCRKSLGDMGGLFSRIDAFMHTQINHDQARYTKAEILCNDCQAKCTVPFHHAYHKCTSCGSYNTYILRSGRCLDQEDTHT